MNDRLPSLFPALSLLLLAACGGGSESPAGAQRAAADTASLALFDAQGRALPTPSSRLPARTEARTRNGLYATAEQLQWQELIAGPVTLVLDIDQLGPSGAALLAQHVRGWSGHRQRQVAWYVRGGAEDEAAQLVNSLADDGVAPVFLVR
jgi:hypothetical protein